MNETLISLCEKFFGGLGADYSNLQLSQEPEREDIYSLKLQSNDSAILIGPHGKHLESITHILKLLLSQQIQKHITLHIEINDYMEKKDEKLFRFIESKIQKVKESGEEIVLPFFTSYERKKVHSFVAEHGGTIYTQSRGEGRERRIYLCKKDEKMSIDIDGSDI